MVPPGSAHGPKKRYTLADLEHVAQPWDDTRYEIIDGELHVSKATHWQHQYACGQLQVALQLWNRQTGAGVAVVAPGLIFSPDDDDVIPDLVWISRERRAALLDERGHLRGAPELVVEVLSPGAANEHRDRRSKLQLYSRQGVQEYWIVDWRAHTVQVFRRGQGALELVATLGDGDSLTSPLLPGFACPVLDLWESPA